MIELRPERIITCLPPWPQAIMFAGKRLENRSPSVAARIGDWRGLVAISQSKQWDLAAAEESATAMGDCGLIDDGRPEAEDLGLPQIGTGPDWEPWDGKIVAVAALIDVIPARLWAHPRRQPHLEISGTRQRIMHEQLRWYAGGDQAGLMLGRVWQVEPVSVTGGRGFCALGECPRCDSVQAIMGHTCRRCGGRVTAPPLPPPNWRIPRLTAVRECSP